MGKKRFQLPVNDVNVVPLMDILTTMLFFLVLMASISDYSVLSADAELNNTASQEEQKPRFELAMWVKNSTTIELHLSAIAKLKVIEKENLIKTLSTRHFSGNENGGYKKIFVNKDHQKLNNDLQQDLILIKKSFPHELRVTLVVEDNIKFQNIIDFMSTVTETNSENGEFEMENFLGKREKTRVLFPEVALREMGKGED